MSADAKWELVILEVVHGFKLQLLRRALEEDVPLPPGLDAESLRQPADVEKTLADMRRWLKLLDFAITPAMVRDALVADIDQDLAEALLRYYVGKKSHTLFDRDKTDFVATFLYRHPRVKGQWSTRGYSMDGVAPLPPFEIALLEILADSELPDLSAEHMRILDQLEMMQEELEAITDFDKLMDSGILPKGRQLKQSLGPGLYHPHSLALIAANNALFGLKFNKLFVTATTHIKSFAEEAQIRGADENSVVAANVRVQDLSAICEQDLLSAEYVHAQEDFRQLSKLKKAVDSNRASQRPRAAAVAAAGAGSARAFTSAAAAGYAGLGESSPGLNMTSPLVDEQESRLRSVQESIRSFVKAADDKTRQVVPMRFGNLILTRPESDAFAAEYLQESSFRGDSARAFVRMVALLARMTGEILELRQRQDSTYLWRPHAQSLQFLLGAAESVTQEANRLIQLANQRGLAEKVDALSASLQKLQEKSREVTAILAWCEKLKSENAADQQTGGSPG